MSLQLYLQQLGLNGDGDRKPTCEANVLQSPDGTEHHSSLPFLKQQKVRVTLALCTSLSVLCTLLLPNTVSAFQCTCSPIVVHYTSIAVWLHAIAVRLHLRHCSAIAVRWRCNRNLVAVRFRAHHISLEAHAGVIWKFLGGIWKLPGINWVLMGAVAVLHVAHMQ